MLPKQLVLSVQFAPLGAFEFQAFAEVQAQLVLPEQLVLSVQFALSVQLAPREAFEF